MPKLIEKGYYFTFKNKVCGVYFPDGRLLAIKAAEDNLFYITVIRSHERYYDLATTLPGQPDNHNEHVIAYSLKPRTINEYHDKFGHLGETLLRKTLRHLNLEVTAGRMMSCDACRMAKVRAMSLKKKTDTRLEIPAERMYIDLTGPFNASLGGSRY